MQTSDNLAHVPFDWAGVEWPEPDPPPPPPRNAVEHPAHYTQGGVECIDAIEAALGAEGFVAFCRGAVLKYAWRSGLKGDAAEDLRKAAWYANRAADALENTDP